MTEVRTTTVEFNVVVAFAALLVALGLLMAITAQRTRRDPSASWLILATLSLIGAALAVLFKGQLGFGGVAVITIGGIAIGVTFAFIGLTRALEVRLPWMLILSGAGATTLFQGIVAIVTESLFLLMITSSVINTLAASAMTLRLFRAARHFGWLRAVTLSLPFLAIGAAYGARLGLGTILPMPAGYLASTAIIALVLGIAAVGWNIGLFTLREAQARDALEAARARVEAVSKAKSVFLRSLSHELRTPLNAVLGLAEVMRHGNLGPLPDRAHEAVEHIHASGRHLHDLIEDLLDLSVIEAGRFRLEESRISAEEVVTAAHAIISEQAARRGTTLSILGAQGTTFIVGDRRRLVQALVNLGSNAIKYSPDKSRIEIGLDRSADNGLDLFVRDEGPGMTEDERVEALSLFGRLESTAQSEQGLGVGLPLTRELIEAHGGRLVLSSTPGRGTTAILALPPERVLQEPQPPSGSASASTSNSTNTSASSGRPGGFLGPTAPHPAS
ncbi:MAG: HAMP domain-containing sensor histidine kinase [Pseudomonadota bacterium]